MKMQTRYAMKVIHTVCAAALLTTLLGAALAQTDFQLPRECSERIVVNPERCVIQDGPPRLPVVHRGTAGSATQTGTQTPSAAANPSPATQPQTSPWVRAAPRR